MLDEIQAFEEYLRDVKKTSKNTQISYRRDLMQMEEYLKGQGITDPDKVTKTSLNSYILFLEKNNLNKKGAAAYCRGAPFYRKCTRSTS